MLRVPEVCRQPESRSGFRINGRVSAFHMDAKGRGLTVEDLGFRLHQLRSKEVEMPALVA